MRRQDASAPYELPQLDAEIPAEWQYPAVHLRAPLVACPLCHQLRAEPSPMRRMQICSECERILFGELSARPANADPVSRAHVRERGVGG